MLIDTPPAWGSPRFFREVVSLDAKAVMEECAKRKLKRQEIKSFDFIKIPPFCHGYPFYDDHTIYYMCSQYFDAVEMGISIRNADGLDGLLHGQRKLCEKGIDGKRNQGMFEVWQKHVYQFLKGKLWCERPHIWQANKEERE